jgi:hypothetical protein
VALPRLRLQDRLLRLVSSGDDRIERWVEAVVARHTASFSMPEFLKAVRALSARYVESRQSLGTRSPLDSAGKRAAFAAFYGPLHFYTARQALSALGTDLPPVHTVIDFGCGTGVVGAAWSLAQPGDTTLVGIDRNAWALAEAKWNWKTLGLSGRTHQADLVTPVRSVLPESHRRSARGVGLVFGWALNEVPSARRESLRDELLDLVSAGASLLVLEPLARGATPWWNGWADRIHAAGGRADEWKFDVSWTARLAALDEAAGFRRDAFSVKTLCLPGSS